VIPGIVSFGEGAVVDVLDVGNLHQVSIIASGAYPSYAAVMAAWYQHLASRPSAKVRCDVPSAEAAAAAWGLQLDFNSAARVTASSIRFTGSAHVAGGQLRLTSVGQPVISSSAFHREELLQPLRSRASPDGATTRFGSGTAIFKLPPGTHSQHLRVNFRLAIGGGDGGEGFSVSVAHDLPSNIGAWGAGLGLRLQFLTTSRPAVVRAVCDHALLAQASLGALRSGKLRQVSLTLNPMGLTLTFAGEAVFSHLSLRGWAPQSGSLIALAAANGERSDNHFVDDLTIHTGAWVTDTAVPLMVTLNGQQFSTALRFVYPKHS